MFEKIKLCVLKIRFKYHHIVGDYCIKMADKYKPEDTRFWTWTDKVVKHTYKEVEILDRVVFGGKIS